MIKYNPKSWFQLIFAFHKSDTFRILWKEIIYIGLFTLLVAYLEINFFPNVHYLDKLVAVYSLVGFVISLLLVFRTNTAYDRWWEGRKKWNVPRRMLKIFRAKGEREDFRDSVEPSKQRLSVDRNPPSS